MNYLASQKREIQKSQKSKLCLHLHSYRQKNMLVNILWQENMPKGHTISCKVVMINGKVKHHRKGIKGNIAKYIYICVFIISKKC
jgi:hypothetical protein